MMVFLDAIRDLLFPVNCPLCLTETQRSGICKGCIALLEKAMLSDGRHCLETDVGKVKCSTVLSYDYEQVRRLEIYLKKTPDKTAASYLACYLAREVRAFGIEGEMFITYVPRSDEGLRDNGFDQAKLLAKILSRFVPDARFASFLGRKGKSVAQKSLSGKERKENVKGKFCALKTSASPKNIVIVDDVFTTGSSLAECVKVLKEAFPTVKLYCVTVAKTCGR